MSMILLVESKDSLATSFSTALSEAGFCVQCEHDAWRALAAADSFDFDAAIIAAELRHHTKEQIAQELRSRDPELPIFVCTEFDESAVARWAVADRMLVLEEPVDEATLVWLLQAHVGNLSGNVPRGSVSIDARQDVAALGH